MSVDIVSLRLNPEWGENGASWMCVADVVLEIAERCEIRERRPRQRDGKAVLDQGGRVVMDDRERLTVEPGARLRLSGVFVQPNRKTGEMEARCSGIWLGRDDAAGIVSAVKDQMSARSEGDNA